MKICACQLRVTQRTSGTGAAIATRTIAINAAVATTGAAVCITMQIGQ